MWNKSQYKGRTAYETKPYIKERRQKTNPKFWRKNNETLSGLKVNCLTHFTINHPTNLHDRLWRYVVRRKRNKRKNKKGGSQKTRKRKREIIVLLLITLHRLYLLLGFGHLVVDFRLKVADLLLESFSGFHELHRRLQFRAILHWRRKKLGQSAGILHQTVEIGRI